MKTHKTAGYFTASKKSHRSFLQLAAGQFQLEHARLHTDVNIARSILTYFLSAQSTLISDVNYRAVYCSLSVYSSVSFIGLLNLCTRYTFSTNYVSGRNCCRKMYALLWPAKKPDVKFLKSAVKFLKSAEKQTHYGM